MADITKDMQNTDNVSVAKGIREAARSGWMWIAPVGTKLPETAVEKLDDAFQGTGFISSDGLVEPAALSLGDPFTDANGDTMATADPTFNKQWTGTFQEYTNTAVIAALFGKDQVNFDPANGEIHVDEKAITLDHHVIVVDEVLSATQDFPQGRRARYVMPNAQIALTDDITHNSTTLLGYGFTVTAYSIPGYPPQRRLIQIAKPTGGSDSGTNGSGTSNTGANTQKSAK